MNIRRKFGGNAAQKNGLFFENHFQRVARRQRIHCERIPDGCKRVGSEKLIRVTTPFDFIIARHGKCAFVDTKTFDSDRINWSQVDKQQLEKLYWIGQQSAAGFVIYFRKVDKVCFMGWDLLTAIVKGQSAKFEEGLILGSVVDFRVSPILDTYDLEKHGNRITENPNVWHESYFPGKPSRH